MKLLLGVRTIVAYRWRATRAGHKGEEAAAPELTIAGGGELQGMSISRIMMTSLAPTGCPSTVTCSL